MAWAPDLTVYHGCDDASGKNIVAHGVTCAKGRPLTDFGQGFYTTTSLRQAKNWANTRVRRLRRRKPRCKAVVLQIDIPRARLAKLASLCFVREGDGPPKTDYWDFVQHCRTWAKKPPAHAYEVVYGLVSLWPQTLVIADCDQISFHDDTLFSALRPKLLITGHPYLQP